jgi:hypothetical protein
LGVVHLNLPNGNAHDAKRLPEFGVPFSLQHVILRLWAGALFPKQKSSIQVEAVPHIGKL